MKNKIYIGKSNFCMWIIQISFEVDQNRTTTFLRNFFSTLSAGFSSISISGHAKPDSQTVLLIFTSVREVVSYKSTVNMITSLKNKKKYVITGCCFCVYNYDNIFEKKTKYLLKAQYYTLMSFKRFSKAESWTE